MNFLYPVKGDTGLLLTQPKNIGMNLLSTWVWGNIEGIPHIPYPLSYGEDIFVSFSMDRRTHLMKPRPHTPILKQNNFICIELSGPPGIQATNPLLLELRNMFVLLFWKGKATCFKKLETVSERKSRIRGLKNKCLLELGKFSTLWLHYMKGWQPLPIFLLVEGGSICLKTPDWHLKLN